MVKENLTSSEALDELMKMLEKPKKITIAELESLVARVSVRDEVAGTDATTYLYSGRVTEDLSTNDLVKDIAGTEGELARIIDRTPAADFLSDIRYMDAVRIALKNEFPEMALLENQDLLEKSVGNYLYDSKSGPWANRSAELVNTISGKVECVVPDAKAGRVWWETEFPNLINNSNVISINGIPREDLLVFKKMCIENYSYTEAQALNILCQRISLESRMKISDLHTERYDLKTISENLNKMSESIFKDQYPSLFEITQKLGEVEYTKHQEFILSNVIDYMKSWQTQDESIMVSEKVREQVLGFEPKEVVDKLSNNGIDQMLIKRELFLNLKNKDDLLEVVDKVKDNIVKNFAREKIYEVNADIKKSLEDLNKHSAVHGDIKSIALDEKNNYLLEKNKASTLLQKNSFNKNNNLEASINDLHKKIMSGFEKELGRTNETGMVNNKALDIKEFCKISMKLEENRGIINDISEKIGQIDKSISKLEEKEKLLSNIENSLKVVDQKPANTHNKLLFFQNKNQQVNKEYEKAISFLKTNGIANWKEFGKAKEEHENNKSSMQKLTAEKNLLKSKKDSLLKDVSEKKDTQKEMMKDQEKTKNISLSREHKLNKSAQMEI